MAEAVLDASALLALLNSEPGADMVAEVLPGSIISAVNLSEVVAKLIDAGIPQEIVRQVIEPLGLEIEPFDEKQAYLAGFLRSETRDAGISLGDRACLSLGKTLGLDIYTADKSWKAFSIGINIRTIR
ncbi:MAG: type II toxin-antitoxin system VapC family toxin [Dehalococcoidales bacterium]|nr:type II toxin-antitoxin system VapC family toxin [Dehalococcoidales bacterium]